VPENDLHNMVCFLPLYFLCPFLLLFLFPFLPLFLFHVQCEDNKSKDNS
jgi:hypothetical protein